MTFPFFGAFPEQRGVRFRVMAPAARHVQLVLHSGKAAGSHDLSLVEAGVYGTLIAEAAPGDRYAYRLGGNEPLPDPASRFQPEGVHGPSEIVDAARYSWQDAAWRGRPLRERILYELHIGTFTPEGTFNAARRRLPLLRDLGVTTIEIMPVADFAGARNWGYDGVCLFAPSRTYGRPDDLRALVDDAHSRGLSVILDVVYNHLGPEGAYLTQFHPGYMTDRHSTPWGDAINLDGPGSDLVRRFILDNAVHWVREYHLDGLRLDATHASIDSSPVHIAAELAEHVRSAMPWPLAVYAEDHRNLAAIVQGRTDGGWGLDGVWADDFHHIIRRLVAGDARGYYEDFDGTAEELARTIRQGWLYTGQPSRRTSRSRGTDPSRVPMQRSVVCLQNHDQVGNRALGDRLHHRIDVAAWRAASVVLLTGPMTPLLFMGQEWAASTPFLYFTDLEPEFGDKVTEGRRREFKDYPEFADPAGQARVPDPQAESTFQSSKLRWEERDEQPHASILALYRELLALRAAHPALQASECLSGEAWSPSRHAIVMRRSHETGTFLIVASLCGGGEVNCAPHAPVDGVFDVILTTEDGSFAPDPRPPQIGSSRVQFQRPGAVVLRFSRI